MGKTTLLQKLALDWSREVTLTSYNHVIYIDGKQLDEDDLACYVQSHLLQENSNVNLKSLQHLFSSKEIQENSLLLIDGFDEIPMGVDMIGKIISGKLFGNSTVLVASRPNFANKYSKYFYDRFMVLGLSVGEREKMIARYVEETDSEEALFTELRKSLLDSQTIYDLGRVPLYLSYLCMLVEDCEGSLPTGKTELFDHLIELMLKKTSEENEEEIQAAVKELCHLAYFGIVENKVQLSESEVRDLCPRYKLALKFGCFMQSMTKSRLNPKKTFSFSHKSVQEFLAAKYMKNSFDEEMICHLKQVANDKNWIQVITFLSGLFKGDSFSLDKLYREVIFKKDLNVSLRYVAGVRSTGPAHDYEHLGIQCLSESGLFVTFEELAEGIIPHAFTFDCASLPMCYHCLQGLTIGCSRSLDHKPELVICGIGDVDLMWLDTLLKVQFPPAIILSNMTTISQVMQYLLHMCTEVTNIDRLHVYIAPLMGESESSMPELANQFSNVPKDVLLSLRALIYKGYYHGGLAFAAEGHRTILNMLVENIGGAIEILGLQELDIQNSIANCLAQKLGNCLKFSKLFLVNVDLPAEGLWKILESVATLGTLNTLHLYNIAQPGPLSIAEKDLIIRNLVSAILNNDLSSFTLGFLDFREAKLEPLFEAISKKVNMKYLCFGGTAILGNREIQPNSFFHLLSSLECLKSIKELHLKRLFLTESSLPDLTTVLICLTKLETFHLCGNDFQSSPAVKQLCTFLAGKHSIKTVNLEQCGFTDVDTPNLIEILGNPRLQYLSLMGNEILGDDEVTERFFSAVANSKSLESINVTCTKVTHSSAQNIVELLSRSHSLKNVRIQTKVNMDILGEMEKITTSFVGKLPGVSTSFGYTVDLLKSSAPGKSDHEIWRDRCLE